MQWMSCAGLPGGVPAVVHILASMDAASALERQARRNRVRRGRRADGILVAIGDADPEVAYACPVCGDALRQKRSCLDKPFFSHIGGDGTCADDAVRYAAAVRVLGDLVDHAVAGRLVMGFTVRCHAGRHEVDHRLDVNPGDIVRREEHGVAILRDGAVVFTLVVHRPHEDAAGHPAEAMAFIVDADDALGWDADEALEDCQAGCQGTLVLNARAMTADVPCGGCAKEREAAQKKIDRAAAAANTERVERCQMFADAFLRSGGRFETCRCAVHPEFRRTVSVGKHYDDIAVDVTVGAERWDVALMRQGSLALGILVVRPDAMVNESDPDHRCRNPGATCFVAVPEDAQVDPRSGAWPTNAWHLLSDGRCPRCDDLPQVLQRLTTLEADFGAGFTPGRREVRPEQIRTSFAMLLSDKLPWYPATIEPDVDAATAAAIERLLAAAARMWPPATAGARRALEAKPLMASVDRICAAFARKHLAADKPPKSAAEIHRSIHWVLDRGDGMMRDDQAAIQAHIAASIEKLVRQAWALWPGHEKRAKLGRQMREDEKDMGLRRRWGRRRDW